MDRHSARGPVRSSAVGAAVVVLVLVLAGAAWWVWRDTRDGGPARAAESGAGLLRNGSFTEGKAPWGSSDRMPTTVEDGRLCAEVPGGTTEPYDISVTQNDLPLVKDQAYEWSFSASASTAGRVIRAVVGLGTPPYDAYFEDTPALGTTARRYVYPFVSSAGTTKGQVAFQVGGSAEPWRFCVDDVTLQAGGSATVYRPDTGSPVRVNQVGYLVDGPKNATVVTAASGARPWQLKAADGSTVAQGSTVPRGMDRSSGEGTQTVDFSSYRTAGTGFRLVAEGQASQPFDIGGIAYQQLAVDALKFFYTQRSGIEIQDILRPGYARPAAHLGSSPNLGDVKVPCQPKVCDYTLDVRGGWYDAGDHGKYVVNGGIAVWQLLDRFERSRAAAKGEPTTRGDGQLAIPESHNDVPDILDEARWELEFMLRMQVPAGEKGAGMVHHKVHDERWTGLPLMPNEDPQKRELHPPSTAATLNLAATAAQAARLYGPYDEKFAGKCLAAAKRAWQAAVAQPRAYAPAEDSVGGGSYDDTDVSDEFYWAAAELYLTTSEQRYAAAIRGSRHHTGDVWRPVGFTWRDTAAMGRLALATVPNELPDVGRIRASVTEGADRYLAAMAAQPYAMPYAPKENTFDWGSNSQVLNNMVVLATAYDLTAKASYRTAVLQAMDYLLGRNALNLSYVTGYGDVYARNQHSRWYAHQLDPDLPNPPHGSLAGGPNSQISDPVAKAKIAGCVGQFCYIDDIKSYSTNELTINWNSALAWIAGFIADQ